MFRILVLSILVFSLTGALASQTRGVGGSNKNPPPARSSIPTMPSTSMGSLFVSGKVVIDDGTLLTDRAAIQSMCKGRTHTEAYTDSKGHFSFEVKSNNQNRGVSVDASDSSQGIFGRGSSNAAIAGADPLRSYLRDCQFERVVAGIHIQGS